jgi:D-lactate dehydrogenase
MAGAAAAGRFVLGAAGKFLPSSFSWLPRPAKPLVRRTNMRDPVVYFPSCASRVFGAYRGASESPDLIRRTESLLDKAGYDAFYPEGADGLCCGLAFASKGFENLAREKAAELAAALEAASAGGQLPILFDTTPCLQRLRDFQNSAGNPGQKKLPLHDIAEFARLYLKPRLHFSPVHETAALHLTCSSLKMGLDAAQKEAAGWCVEKLVLPETGCCGVAGDKGFFVPEISRSALRGLKEKLGGAANGYATSRTCEMGLTRHSGIFYESLAVLLDKASSPAKSGSGKRKKQHA